mgnify:CR=1 FL=1
MSKLEDDEIYKMWRGSDINEEEDEEEEEEEETPEERYKLIEFERIFPIYLNKIKYSWGNDSFSLFNIIDAEKKAMGNNGVKKFKIFKQKLYESNLLQDVGGVVGTDTEDGGKESDEDMGPAPLNLGGGFFFKGSRTRKKRKKKKNKRKTLKRNEKGRKWTDTGFPYRGITKSEAIREFLRLKKLAKGNINPRSTVGNGLIDYGTEKARRKTKYRNRSFIEQWNNKTRRKKVIGFAKRLKKKDPNKSVLTAMRSAIDLQWGSVNTMRAAAAIQMYKKYKATRVLDFTAGWGARMVAAMALDIDYIGIDSNKSLKPGYDKLISLLKPYTKSKIRMIYKEAQKVNMSKLGKFDYVFTSPPYEYLEAYEHMKNYESSGKIKQPSSSQKIKMSDSAKFYDDFLVPTLKNAYKNLPVGKYICLNMPDIMYDKIKKRWKGVTKKEAYNIVKRTGGKWGSENRRGKELIFCWKKR